MSYGQDYAHSGIAPETTLAVGVTTASDTTITLTSGTGWPSPTGGQLSFGVLNPDTATESKFTYTGRAGAVLSGVTFSADGSTAAATYAIGVFVRHVFSAQEAGEANDAVRLTIGKVDAANQFLVSDAANSFAKKSTTEVVTILAEPLQDLVGAMVSGGTETGIAVTYDDTNARLDFVVSGTAAFVGALVKNTGTQVVNTGAAAAVAFDAEDNDSGTIHDTVTNNSRLTIPTTGKYLVVATLAWANGATVSGLIQFYFKVNGTIVNPGNVLVRPEELSASSSQSRCLTAILSLTATNYVEVFFDNASGSNATLQSSCTMQIAAV